MTQIASIAANSIPPTLITTNNELSNYAFARDIQQVHTNKSFTKKKLLHVLL